MVYSNFKFNQKANASFVIQYRMLAKLIRT